MLHYVQIRHATPVKFGFHILLQRLRGMQEKTVATEIYLSYKIFFQTVGLHLILRDSLRNHRNVCTGGGAARGTSEVPG